MQKLLDPTLDIVFKLLFTSGPDSDIALRDLLTAVLAPPRPIAAVSLINPAITGAEIATKSIALDLLLELDGGTKIDIEMQARDRGAFRNRALYYWAKLYGGQLDRGDGYAALKPAISVLFLDYRELPGQRVHSIFQVLETRDHSRLSDAFEMHLIELPKLVHALPTADRLGEISLLQWTRFFAAKTDEDRKEAAMSNPAIQKAHAVLERLSADPDTQQLARQRELAQQTYRIEMSAALDKGRDEGLEKGLEKGHRSGLRTAILDACALLDITPTAEQLDELERLDISGLDALRARLKQDRCWTLGRFPMAECNDRSSDPPTEDPAILKAHSVLERLSADPDARQREMAQQTYRIEMSAALDKGRREALGHARAAILDVCKLLGITPTDEQRAELARLDGSGLDVLRARLMEDRRWA